MTCRWCFTNVALYHQTLWYRIVKYEILHHIPKMYCFRWQVNHTVNQVLVLHLVISFLSGINNAKKNITLKSTIFHTIYIPHSIPFKILPQRRFDSYFCVWIWSLQANKLCFSLIRSTVEHPNISFIKINLFIFSNWIYLIYFILVRIAKTPWPILKIVDGRHASWMVC